MLRTARCNIINAEEWGGQKISTMHRCGNLIVEAYRRGYKQREPGLAYCTLKDVPAERRNKRSGVAEDIERTVFAGGGGFFSSDVYNVHADPNNGLVWAVGDRGKRIKGFRAGAANSRSLARCNRETTGRQLQHTFWRRHAHRVRLIFFKKKLVLPRGQTSFKAWS